MTNAAKALLADTLENVGSSGAMAVWRKRYGLVAITAQNATTFVLLSNG